MKQYVGELMVQDALSHGSKKSCSKVYKKDVCPWDGAAMMKVNFENIQIISQDLETDVFHSFFISSFLDCYKSHHKWKN